MANKKSTFPSEEERLLFQQAVADARRLNLPEPAVQRSPPPPEPRQTRRDEQQVLLDSLNPLSLEDELIETGDELRYRRPEVSLTLLRKLRRGEFTIQDQLDLHGKNTREAADALGQFLAQCAARGLRTVRIVHGKGNGSPQKRPVLKGKVALWLQRREDVLAYCSARTQDGGTGALYVLLKAARPRST